MREKLLLAAACVGAFGASLGGAFQFDDFALLSDPVIASVSGWWESWRLEQTRPLTWFTFWINYQLSGEHPAAYHAVNLALHVAVTLLLVDVLARLIPARAVFAAAAIFAVHPALSEPVNYIFARGTLLAALFSLLAIRAWIAGAQWPAVPWFAVAMLAKEECVALPVFLILLDWSRGRTIQRRPIGAMLGIAVTLGVRAVWATAAIPGSQAGVQAGISPVGYFTAQGIAIWGYLQRFFLPWGFSADYEIAQPPVWLAVAAWAAIGVSAVLATKRFLGLALGFWFIAGIVLLLPSSSVFPASDLAADRRMYLPMIALSAGLGMLLANLDRRVLGALVLVLAAISVRYTLLWRTPEALWREAVARSPHKLRPRIQLARGVPADRALEILKDAQGLAPEDANVASEQGRALLTLGRADEALAAFGRSLALDPSDAGAMNNRGAALAALGQAEAARADFERALARDPCLFDARLNLARMGTTAKSPPNCRFTPKQRALLDASR